MAEYCIDIPVAAEKLELDLPATLEKIDLDISVLPEKKELEGGNLRGNSAGKTGGANGRAKVLPNYLSSPTGSCHDFCKYGTKPVFGKKAERVRATSGEGEDLKQTATVGKQRKKSATSLKPSPDPKTQLPDHPSIIKRDVRSLVKNAVVSSEQLSSPGKDADVLLKHDSDLKLKVVKTKPSLLPNARVTKEIGILPSSPLGGRRSRSNSGIGPPLGGPRAGRNTGIGLGKDRAISVMGKKKVSAAPAVKRVASKKARTNTNVEGVSPLKNQSNARKTKYEHPRNENVPEKILHVIEPKAANKTVGTTQNSLHTTKSSPSLEGKSLTLAKKGTRFTHLASSPEKKNQRQAQTGVHTSHSPPSISPPSMKKSLQHTQNGIHTKQSSVSSLASISSPTSPSESVQSEVSGTISEHSATEIENHSKVEYKKRSRRVGKISSGDKDDLPHELNSRRGLQYENNSPRRLRLKKGRGLCEADFRQRSFKRTEVVHIDLADAKTEFEKVVLRHQDVEGNKDTQTSLNNKNEVVLKHQDVEDKKDNQNFLNNVIEEVVLRHHDVVDKKEIQSLLNSTIEETASKLVKTRKSKVKALVSAFESLISLQDTARTATTRAH
ncbi:hypothetical protein PVL29_022478 [Vitis rotundifolia]|uniref:Calmodulin-binding domain-containing protein n=1 Tax=Vitis rotundifolia TaxID=103349 RepID=A0AA38YVX3_VITRO|nr:hypothetical protein PVL29_022478 [Vitis rotundifolia]